MSREIRVRLGARCPVCLDFHAHFVDATVMRRCRSFSPSSGFGSRPFPIDSPAFQRLLNPALQIEDMDARGIDRQLISSADVVQGRSWLDPSDEIDMVKRVNETAQNWVASYPGRFIGSCVLPLGDLGAALRELEQACATGTKVVVLPANYRGIYLGQAHFAPLWELVARLGVVCFVHPDGTCDPWFQAYSMWNSIGQSIEEVKVMTSIIYEGVLDRHPGLKIVMAHGGGYMPYYMGRLDRNAREKPATTQNIRKLPSAYLSDFWYDSCVYDGRTLEMLVERVGVSRVVMGGDYPVAAPDPLVELDAARGLEDEQRSAIAGNNAALLLGLRATMQ